MRYALLTVAVLCFVIGSAAEARAKKRHMGGDGSGDGSGEIDVQNLTGLAIRVRITQGNRRLAGSTLQPNESLFVRVPRGTSRDRDAVEIFAIGLEPPIDRKSAHVIDAGGLSNRCYEVRATEDAILSFTVVDCILNDPENPGGKITSRLDSERERTVTVAASSGLLLLAFASYLLGRAPRRRDEDMLKQE